MMMPDEPSWAIGERPNEWLVDLFFERIFDLVLRVRNLCSASLPLTALSDALIVSYQSRESYAQHLAQAVLDPSRYADVSHALESFGERLVNSVCTPESLELVLCWLSYARIELLETLQAEAMFGSTGLTGWESAPSASWLGLESVAA